MKKLLVVCMILLAGCGVDWFPDGTTPTAFLFASKTNVGFSTIVKSDTVTPSGFTNPTPITVTNGEYSLDGGDFTSAPGTIKPGQKLQLQHTSASTPLTSVTTTVKIGDFSTTFISTTGATDTTPDQFTFISPTLRITFERYSSNAVTITGISQQVPISISGDGTFSIDGGSDSATPK